MKRRHPMGQLHRRGEGRNCIRVTLKAFGTILLRYPARGHDLPRQPRPVVGPVNSLWQPPIFGTFLIRSMIVSPLRLFGSGTGRPGAAMAGATRASPHLDSIFKGSVRLPMFIKPRSLREAVETLSTDGGVPLAGGTDLFPAWVDRQRPERIVDLRGIAEMRGIAVGPDSIRIGGGTTWSEIIAAELPPRFDCLKAAAREVGSVQIQNAGTLAGNLCNASPAADGVPPLLVLDAEVELASPSGTRRLPLAEFILGNRKTARRRDEILAAIIVPRCLDNARSAFLKLGARRYLVISIVMVAAAIERDPSGRIVHAAVAVGSASETARRMTALEAKLLAAEPGRSAASLVEPGDLALSPIDDVRASAAYRADAALTLVRRVLSAVDGAGNA